ncbi:MAG: PAS domain S-box protein [Bacteroidetes bacterium]|nr:PAS domain S-box protein [Bacteroidota bacterium]
MEENLFTGLLESAPDAIIGINSNMEILFFNQQAEKVFGYSAAEIKGRSHELLIPSRFLAVHKNHTSNYFNSPSSRNMGNARSSLFAKRKDGSEFPADISLNMLQYKGENIVIVSVRDISDKKQLENDLNETATLYSNLFFSSPLPIGIFDKATMRCLDVNEKAIQFYGYSKEEFLKLTAFDIRVKEDLESLKTSLVQGDYSWDTSIRKHSKKNGEIAIIEPAIAEINYKGKPAYLITILDLTEKMRLQGKLITNRINHQKEITKAAINAQEKERKEIGSELHDNVNQLLVMAKLYLESGLTTPDKKDEMLQKSIHIIETGIEEIRKLSRSLNPPSLGDISLKEAIESLIEDLPLPNKTIQLKEYSIEEADIAEGLKVSIYRIIQEKLNNIVKHADATSVTISLKQNMHGIDIEIIDNGKGFDLTAKRKGIGITNIINRAETYDGEVIFDTAPGKGCRLLVHFPAQILPSDRYSGNQNT